MSIVGGVQIAAPDGPRSIARPLERVAKVVIRLRGIGLDRQRLPQGFRGIVPSLLAEQGEAELHQAIVGLRLNAEVPAENGLGFRATLLLVAEASEEEQSLGILREGSQQFVDGSLGFRELLRDEQGVGGIRLLLRVAAEILDVIETGVRSFAGIGQSRGAAGELRRFFGRALPLSDLREQKRRLAGASRRNRERRERFSRGVESSLGKQDATQSKLRRGRIFVAGEDNPQLGGGHVVNTALFQQPCQSKARNVRAFAAQCRGSLEMFERRPGILRHFQNPEEMSPAGRVRIELFGLPVTRHRLRQKFGGVKGLPEASPTFRRSRRGDDGCARSENQRGKGGIKCGDGNLWRRERAAASDEQQQHRRNLREPEGVHRAVPFRRVSS